MNRLFRVYGRKRNLCRKVFAFTLAETLIVMGIIGVVAALTLPNLNQSTNNKEKVVKVKKLYSNMNDAMGRATAVYGPFNEWSDNITKVGDRVSEFMKVSKNCGTNGSDCFHTNVKSNSGSNSISIDNKFYKFITADGSSVAIGPLTQIGSTSVSGVFIIVDIDGKTKGANIASKDIFAYKINSDNGQVELLYNGDSDFLVSECFYFGTVGCTDWVILNDNMDYLNAGTDGKCKNNTSIVLNVTTNTTCR